MPSSSGLQVFLDYTNGASNMDNSPIGSAGQVSKKIALDFGTVGPRFLSDGARGVATDERGNPLRIDPDEQTVQRDGEGYWVRAWVHVDAAGLGEAGAAQIDRYASAVTALPEITRQVFMAHLLGDEDFTAIAARLGITTHEVEQRIADALVAIGRVLDRR